MFSFMYWRHTQEAEINYENIKKFPHHNKNAISAIYSNQPTVNNVLLLCWFGPAYCGFIYTCSNRLAYWIKQKCNDQFYAFVSINPIPLAGMWDFIIIWLSSKVMSHVGSGRFYHFRFFSIFNSHQSWPI